MAAKTNSIIAGCIKWLCSKEISVYELSIKNPNTSNYLILFRYFKDIEFFLNLAKISQILENFAKISNKFLGQNFLDIILEHFMETAWIVGPLRQAKRIFSWILLRHTVVCKKVHKIGSVWCKMALKSILYKLFFEKLR